jgi:type I restriction enzyme S subunit
MEKIFEKEQVKKGYKKTVIGLIPKDWEVKKLGSLGETLSGLTYSPEDIDNTGVLVLRSSNVKERQIELIDNVYVKVVEDKYNKVQEGDILICVRNGSKSLIGKNALITKEVSGSAFGAFMSVFRGDFNYFLYQVFDTDIYQREIHKNLGATINSINGSDLKKFLVPIPPKDERIKIASILSSWDEAITATKTLIVQTKKRNQGLAQQLLTGKTRLKGFEGKWKFEKISSVTDRIKNSFIPEKETFYKQIGIRSHGKGLFYKESVSGESLGNKSVFWLEPNCFIVNIVFAWEQAVAKTTENEKGMIASHRFPMFKPKNDILDLDFILYFFKSPKGKDLLTLASPGGAGRNKTLGQSDFSKLKIPVPEIKEQQAISKVLETANQELKTLEQKLNVLQEQKKGLMQKLLTGEIRVKIN